MKVRFLAVSVIVLSLAFALAKGVLLADASTPALPAAAFTITKTADTNDGVCDADCSLREAIIAANATPGADTITLPAGTYTLSIAGRVEDAAATGDLDITGDLTITGSGAATTIIDGDRIDRVFHIIGVVKTSISEVTITRGDYFDWELRSCGGGIFVQSGGQLTLTGSVVSSNTAFYGGGIYSDQGTLTVISSTVNGNAGVNGGGIVHEGTLNMVNSTVSGNTAEGGGMGITGSGTANLNNVTIAYNFGFGGWSSGGGISGGKINAKNTIIAENTADHNPDCQGTLHSQGHNLIQNTTGCTIDGDATGNITGVSPNLGPLQNNGGTTFTHALMTGSLAIDAGNPAASGSGGGACAATDQRGVSRPQGSRCDIGAYETVGNPCIASSGLNVCALQVGDILLKTGPTFGECGQTYRAVFALGGTYFTHSALYLGQVAAPGGDPNVVRPRIAEAQGSHDNDADEVWETWLADTQFSTGDCVTDWVVVRPSTTSGAVEGAINYARQKAAEANVIFDISANKEDPQKFYCSKLVWKSYRDGAPGGPDLEADRGLGNILFSSQWVTPDDLFYSSPIVQEKSISPGQRIRRGFFYVWSPGHLTLVDPLGRRAGYDPATGSTFSEIPEVSYFAPPDVMAETITAPGVGSDWQLVVTGFDTGTYGLESGYADQRTRRDLLLGSTYPGKVETYPVADPIYAIFLPMVLRSP